MAMKLLGYLAEVVVLAGTSQALTCYLCISFSSANGCGEYDFDPSVASLQNDAIMDTVEVKRKYDCSVCAMYVAYQPSSTVVARSGSLTLVGPCVPESSVEGKIKCCYTDYCNSFTGDPSSSMTTTPHNPNSYQTAMPRGNNNSLGTYSDSTSMFSGVTSIAVPVIMSLFLRLLTSFSKV